MSESNSTAPAVPDKPVKPSPEFPLFAHATGRWAKKINGKTIYFGRWSEPTAALHRYETYLKSGTLPKAATRPRQRRRNATAKAPSKPYPDFPLFAHATKRWAKKIRGHTYYFGPWDDPDGALESYERQKEALRSGRTPKPDADGLTVKDLVNAFLNAKQEKVNNGELSPRTWACYKEATDAVIAAFTRHRLVVDLRPTDFARLRNRLAKRYGPHGLGTRIQCVRCAFKWAFDAELLDLPIRFGPDFKRPSKKTLRLHRAKQGAKLFTAEQVQHMLDAAGVQMRAMILLGINCGLGNSDIGQLPQTALDLDCGLLDYPRPKTGIARRAILWPETVEAIRQALAIRPEPKDEADVGLVFITKYGKPWHRDTKKLGQRPLTHEFAKLVKPLKIAGSFYVLRHTFRTVADEAHDQPAADFIMGHEAPHMSTHYRERISDERLRAVSDHVRAWLFDKKKRK